MLVTNGAKQALFNTFTALATRQALGNEYERAQYLDAARAHGVSEACTGAAEGRAVAGLTAAEEAVRRLTLAMVFASPPTPALAAAGAHLDARGPVAIVHLAARFVATSRISHALSLRPMTGPSRAAHDEARETAAE
ncbi:hypothetical protein [Streptomyces sp. NPDC004629]|uniref:hypothetical protein n=1 Tax=Streptomyces sp. NPDC004629 TaxID=3364705 RepID=UPI0036AF655D